MNARVLDLMKEVPCVEAFGAVVREKNEDALGNLLYVVEKFSKNQYMCYLDELQKIGFRVCMEIGRPGGSYIRNATYRKGELFISLQHGTKETRISYHLNPDYVQTDPYELFAPIPNMQEYGIVANELEQVGDGNWQIVIERTIKEHYDRYLQKLEQAGFTKFADNGDGLDGKVFNSVFTKDNLVVTVTHLKKTNKTYIAACQNLPLSEHLFYKEDYVKGNWVGAKTKLHMVEMWSFGNSFIFQLKNGHFLVSDGGFAEEEVYYFLEYIEGLVPKGEKPIIEAWFISHPHPDHSGVMRRIGRIPELTPRIYVEGIYYNEPSDCVLNMHLGCARVENELMKSAAKNLMTTKGTHPKIYRTQTGQRYYFNDITVDVILGQEQLAPEKYYKNDINECSTWLMFHIEGQKCLFGGDGHTGGMHFIMQNYDRAFMKLDIVTSLHHSANSKNYFTDFCTIDTLLVTRGAPPTRRLKENEYLRSKVQEWFSRAEGTRILTFPYKVGSSEILPHFDWKYHQGKEKPNH